MRRRLVPISELAAYAADPKGYLARKGAAISPQAAAFGRSFHHAFARPARSVPVWRWAVFGFLALLFFAWLYLAA